MLHASTPPALAWRTAVFVALCLACDAFALECPALPQQSQRDLDMAVAVAVDRLRDSAGAELQTRTRTVTTDLLRRLPRADRVYLEQMMYATYCSTLRDNPALSEAERDARIRAYNREVRAALTGPAPAASKPDPRDVARAELARLPVEYTPDAFIDSVEAGNAKVARLFIQAGMDPNALARRGVSALMLAAGRGDLALMEMLLKAGAEADPKDGRMGTPLSWAAGGGHLDAMRVLLKLGARRESIERALRAAVRSSEADAARLLIEHGATVRADDGQLLSLTVGGHKDASRQAETVRLLLANGAQVDATFAEGQTALMGAAFGNDVKLMRLLLAAGASVDRRCDCRSVFGGGHTPLTMAIAGEAVEAAQILLDAGAPIEQASNDGTPLMLAVRLGRRRLVDSATRRGRTALIVAARAGSVDAARLLLRRGASPAALDEDRRSAVDHAKEQLSGGERARMLALLGHKEAK